MGEITSVCVFCGSRRGFDPRHEATAAAVGRLVAEEGLTLVYGGGSVGLMGVLADAALTRGGEVVGVMPRGLFRREQGHGGLSRLVEVDSMHRRKQVMFELADAFVALPGGLGTLEELAEMATWAQLGLHRKPLATLAADDFFDGFHAFVRSLADRGFLDPALCDLVVHVARPEDLLVALHSYDRPGADHERRRTWRPPPPPGLGPEPQLRT